MGLWPLLIFYFFQCGIVLGRLNLTSTKVSNRINATKIDQIFSGRCSEANQIFQFGRCLFFINRNIFRHLKLEIALAIPASNEGKVIWNHSAGQGLKTVLALKGFRVYGLLLSAIFLTIIIARGLPWSTLPYSRISYHWNNTCISWEEAVQE